MIGFDEIREFHVLKKYSAFGEKSSLDWTVPASARAATELARDSSVISDNQPEKLLATVPVLALKRSDRLVWRKTLDSKLASRDQKVGLGELLQIESPVAAQFEISAQLDEIKENRVAVIALFEVSFFRPRIGVE